ncbi:MAG: serine/threonine protein kinase [Subdoligranulum sp.]|nr:serine/threonine protein kinase [Subdoligranulum sp.]
MEIIELDDIRFRLQKRQDFRWLNRYGRAFWCVDQTGSGCICIGMERAGEKVFCKIAGVGTVEAEVSPEESVRILKNAVSLYRTLRHPALVRIIEEYEQGPFYAAIFAWAEGECLFDHWNFERYANGVPSPRERFLALPAAKRLAAVDVLFSFLQNVAEKGYAAVDFYDGSILYDFETDKLTICDIDLFRKSPTMNNMGADWYGTKRLKAPEEYELGGVIDERTTLFTLGALIFDFFGGFSEEEIAQRYAQNRFLPCALSRWQLNAQSYRAAERAVCADKAGRYQSIAQFWNAWHGDLCR